MRTFIATALLFALSFTAQAADTYNESGPGPIQNHECQGGHSDGGQRQRRRATMKFWYGSESEYQALPTKDGSTIYFRSA